MGVNQQTIDKSTVNGSASKPLTREQRRRVEMETQKAMIQFNALCNRFSDFIYNTDDLTDEQVKVKGNELNAKWSLYVREHRLNESSKLAFREYCEKLYEAYKAELRGEGAELKAGEPEGGA